MYNITDESQIINLTNVLSGVDALNDAMSKVDLVVESVRNAMTFSNEEYFLIEGVNTFPEKFEELIVKLEDYKAELLSARERIARAANDKHTEQWNSLRAYQEEQRRIAEEIAAAAWYNSEV